jgi:hypothetical protein
VLQTFRGSDDRGGISTTSGLNDESGSGHINWNSQWQSNHATSDVVSDSPIAADMTGSVSAVRNETGSKMLGWWIMSQANVLVWQGVVATE